MTEAHQEQPEEREVSESNSSQANNNAEQEVASIKEVAEQFTQSQDKSQEYEVKIAELNDQMLRVAADAQNIKRRAKIDIENAGKYSIEKFARDMIGVLDNLFRAEDSINSGESSSESEHIKSIKEGVDLTKNEMISALRRHGVERITPMDQPFDHNFHQAIAQVPSEDKKAGTVIDVMQAGYTIKGRLLRPALVAVAKAPEPVAPAVTKAVEDKNIGDLPKTEEF